MIHLHEHKRWKFLSNAPFATVPVLKAAYLKKIKNMFSQENKIFIVNAFAKNPSPSDVRRKFIQHFKIKGRKTKSFHIKQFIRVYEQLKKKTSSVHRISPTKPFEKRTPEAQEKVKQFFAQNQNSSIRQGAREVDLSASTTWRILRKYLKNRFYHYAFVQPLSEAHKQQRKELCHWLLQQPEDFVQRVIWTDEKIFCLKQKPNRKTFGI